MANSSKVLVDVEGGNNMMYIPLDKMVGGGSNVNSSVGMSSTDQSRFSSSAGLSSDTEVDELADRVLQRLREKSANTTAPRREGR